MKAKFCYYKKNPPSYKILDFTYQFYGRKNPASPRSDCAGGLRLNKGEWTIMETPEQNFNDENNNLKKNQLKLKIPTDVLNIFHENLLFDSVDLVKMNGTYCESIGLGCGLGYFWRRWELSGSPRASESWICWRGTTPTPTLWLAKELSFGRYVAQNPSHCFCFCFCFYRSHSFNPLDPHI